MHKRIFLVLALAGMLPSPVYAAGQNASALTPPATLKVPVDGDTVHKHVVITQGKTLIVELGTGAHEVLVSKPSIVDAVIRGPKRIYLMALKDGVTNAFFFDAAGHQLLTLDIRVDKDADDLNTILQDALPGANIEVAANNGGIILTGSVGSASQALRAQEIAAQYAGGGKVVNQLKVNGVDQVMLKVRIAEVSRSVTKQLGINLSASGSMAVPGGGGSIAGAIVSSAIDSSSSLSATAGNFSAKIQALETLGLIHTLAEPNLVAVSGESAKFLAGGEFPVASGRDTSGNVSVTFKQFGVGLSFTPVVLGPGRISLQLSTEVSQLTNTGALTVTSGTTSTGTSTSDSGTTTTSSTTTIPALSVRRAETTIELPSGGSFAIAGLMQHVTNENLNGVPWLKDLPVLGALFRSRSFQNDETELVVMVTAYLVNPVAPSRLATPADGFVSPSDAEALLLERLNHTYAPSKTDKAAAPQKDAAKSKDDVGYIVP